MCPYCCEWALAHCYPDVDRLKAAFDKGTRVRKKAYIRAALRGLVKDSSHNHG